MYHVPSAGVMGGAIALREAGAREIRRDWVGLDVEAEHGAVAFGTLSQACFGGDTPSVAR